MKAILRTTISRPLKQNRILLPLLLKFTINHAVNEHHGTRACRMKQVSEVIL